MLYAPLYAASFAIGEVPGLKVSSPRSSADCVPLGALAGLGAGVVETGASRYLPAAFGEASALVILMLICS